LKLFKRTKWAGFMGLATSLFLAVLVGVGCSGGVATPVPAATPTSIPAATATPIPAATPTPVDLVCNDNASERGGTSSTVETAGDCSCVWYVKNKFGITEPIGDAKDIGKRLPDFGFLRVPNPQTETVVIFQPSPFWGTWKDKDGVDKPWVNPTWGHTGVISEVSDLGSNWSITVRGANQGGHEVEAGCSNVNDVRYPSYPKNSDLVSYWVPPLPAMSVPAATATPVPAATATPASAVTATPVPAATPTPAPAATATPVPTATATPVPAATATPVPTATATPVPTATATPVPAATATGVPAATATPVPAVTATPVPAATATPVPAATPTPVPAATATPTPTPAGPAAVNLGTAGNYVILSKSGLSTTGVTSIVGDLGASPIDSTAVTGFGLIMDASGTFSSSTLVTGKVFAADYTSPTPSNLTTAVSNMEAAYTDAAGRPTSGAAFLNVDAGNIVVGRVFVPGVYTWGTGVTIPTGGITISGGANDVWIFQISGTLTASSGAIVTLTGGAQAKNIFWQVADQTTLETTSQFKGVILDQTAIVLKTGARLDGRALAQMAVTLDANTVTKPN